jgi:hypothetical protein
MSHFDWEKAELRHKEETYQQKPFERLSDLMRMRCSNLCFLTEAQVSTLDCHNDKVLLVRRTFQGHELLCFASFSDADERVYTDCLVGTYKDLFTDWEVTPGLGLIMTSHQYL